MNCNLQKIVSRTTRNNIKLASLAYTYIKSFASGIGMSEEKSENIAFLTREALERQNYQVRPDEFSIKKMGTEGQRFCMTFYLEPQIDILSFKKQDDVLEELLDESFQVRRVHSDEKEITEIMRCIYYNFGFDYPNCHIYETPHLSKLLESGKQWFYLGMNDHDFQPSGLHTRGDDSSLSAG